MKNSIKIWLSLTLVFAFHFILSTTFWQEIVIDPITKKIYISGWLLDNTSQNNFLNSYINSQISTWTSDTWTQNTWNTVVQTTNTVQTTTNLSWGTEFDLALAWMYANWITKYNNSTSYRPYDNITREETAKIIAQAYIKFWYSQLVKNNNCSFEDSNIMNPELTNYISNVCSRNIMKWKNNNFMPQNNLTKAQIISVLIRIFEQKSSNENQTPRRNEYYLKWKAIWLTKETNMNNMENNSSRYEVAIMIFRLKNIVENAQLKAMSLDTIGKIQTQYTQTWNIIPPTQENLWTNLWNLFVWTNVSSDPELTEAVNRMYDNWLTQYNSPSTYNPFWSLTRDASAKILDKFSNLLNLSVTSSWYSPIDCNFTDLWWLDEIMQSYISNVCKKWLMKWWNWLFTPWDNVTKAQFMASLIRMFDWKTLDETAMPRWKSYFNRAMELWIVSASDGIWFDNPISRYEVALFIYRFKVKYLILNSLNQSKVKDEIITTVPWSTSTWANNKPQANVYVDTNMINDWSFNIWYIEILWTRYKIVKNTTAKYSVWDNSFVRYGDLFDLESDSKIWTTSFIVWNWYLIEWTVRINDRWNYKIQSATSTSAYYQLNQI